MYKILDRRVSYTTKEISHADTDLGDYVLTNLDNGYWLKVDTTDGQINLVIPTGLPKGFSLIVENTGEFRVNLDVEVGVDLYGTHNYIDVQYSSTHLFHEGEDVYRTHGALGTLGLTSLSDVLVPGGSLSDRKRFEWDATISKAIFVTGVPRRFHVTKTASYAVSNTDMGKVIIMDTTAGDLYVTLDEDLAFLPDWNCQIHNIGPNDVILQTSGNFLGNPTATTIPPHGRAEATLLGVASWLIWGNLV